MKPKILVAKFANKNSKRTHGFTKLRSTEHMTRIILVGSSIANLLIFLLLIYSTLVLGHTYIVGRVAVSLIVFVYLLITSLLLHNGLRSFAAWLLIALYSIVGILILHTWGINAPIGILILGFTIFLTSVMLGSRHIIFITVGIIVTLSVLQYLNIIGIVTPNTALLKNESSYGDVAGYSIIFAVFATVAWLSGAKMEKVLKRAIDAEATLQQERDALAARVEEQTKHLIESQQKELKQLYKFAELGQLTTIILHELANYLSVLTLDIEDLKERHENSLAIERAKESIFYIETIIDQVRNQIRDSSDTKKFNALTVAKETTEQLRKRLNKSNIKLFIEHNTRTNYYIFGDPLRLSQAITILVTNAVQANQVNQSEISIDISSTNNKIMLSVKDFGTGITEEARRTLFQPQKSSKNSGLGIGLYITKQIIDTHFKGKIWLSPAIEYTQFNIEIPRR